jgi:hypothetical protein
MAGELWTLNIGLTSAPSESVSKGTSPGLVCLAKAERRGEDLDGFLVCSMLDKARRIAPGGGRPRACSIFAVSADVAGTEFKLARLYSPPLGLSVSVLATAVTSDGATV